MKSDIITFIKKQTEILENKLSISGPISTHCALTDFHISLINKTNKVTPFKYRLTMEDDDEESVDD